MKEIVCSHCGAVFFAAPDAHVCPHCGLNPHSWLPKIRARAFPHLGLVIWVAIIAIWRPLRTMNNYLTIFVSVVVDWVWSEMRRETKRGPRATSIEPSGRNDESTGAFSETPFVPQPPSLPPEWQPLMSAARPREVFWPWRSRIDFLALVAILLGCVALMWFLIHGHRWAPVNWHALRGDDLFLAAVAALCMLAIGARVYTESGKRHLLRDGEATVGLVVDWSSGGPRGAFIIYQFWTRVGERFERQGRVQSNRDSYDARGVVPVFYLPEDPSRSLALCCTSLRVRIPAEEFEARMQRAGAK